MERKITISLIIFGFSATVAFSQCQEKIISNYKQKAQKTNSLNLKKKSANTQLAKYYEYMCECSNGSSRSKELILLINRIVDVNERYHRNKYGKIQRVKTCKTL